MNFLKLKSIVFSLIAVVMLSVFLTSCEKDMVDPIDQDQTTQQKEEIQLNTQSLYKGEFGKDLKKAYSNNVEVFENVVPISTEQNNLLLNYSDEELTFQQSELSNFEVGQILNSRPSALATNGYNAEIISKTTINDTFIYQVKLVGLEDVIEDGGFEYLSSDEIVQMRSGDDLLGEGWNSKNINFNVNGTYNKEPFYVKANVKGNVTLGISYKRSGWLGDQDDYIKTYVGVNLLKDAANPDIHVSVGAKGSTTLYTLHMGTYGFMVGPVWLWFGNRLKLNAAADSNMSANVSAGLDLHGTAWLQIEKSGNQPEKFTNGSNIQVDWITPSIDNLVNATLTFKWPQLVFESDLYNLGGFMFFGQFDHYVKYKINPAACDYRLKVYRGAGIRGGIKGKIAKFSYQIDTSKDLGSTYSTGEFPGNCNTSAGNPSTPIMNFSTTHNVKFKSTDNRYLCSENGGAFAIANRTAAGAWGKFTLEKASDNTYAIKGSNGKYADVDRGNQSRIKFSNSNPNCSDCRFKIVDAGSGYVAIKNTATGKYLSSEGTYDIPVRADRSSIAHWEKWKMIE